MRSGRSVVVAVALAATTTGCGLGPGDSSPGTATLTVTRDYGADPVSRAYDNFFGSEEFRTCKKCGDVMPAP